MPHSHSWPTRHAARRAPLALSLVIPAVLTGCATGEAAETARQGQEPFIGMVVYEARAGGTNTDGAELFNAWGPQREVVTWGSGGRLRVETTGGILEGIIVARMPDSAFFALDTLERTAHPAELSSLNPEDIDPEVMALFGERFNYPLVEPTGEEGTYAGRRCRMYVVRRSGVLRRGATARACLAGDIRFRPSSYSFEWNGGRSTAMVSLPVAFNFREGLPLMLEVNEDETIVTYTAVSITPGEPDDALFSVPEGYAVAEPEPEG